jgi:hypothetical protein
MDHLDLWLVHHRRLRQELAIQTLYPHDLWVVPALEDLGDCQRVLGLQPMAVVGAQGQD